MMRILTIGLILLTSLNSAARPRTARAPDAARQRAARRFAAGSAAYAAGRFAAALAEFEAGYAARPSPPFLVNIGQCLRKLDRLDAAALAFRRFLAARSGSPSLRLEVWEALDDTLTRLSARADALAESAALFRAFLASGDGDPALRARVRATLDEIFAELVRLDDGLNAGFGVGRALALPAPAAAARASPRISGWR
jgi:tetratricopeptide (TPR) repeat protein